MAQLGERIKSVASLLVGVLSGIVLASRTGLSEAGFPWVFLAIVGFVAGLLVGHRAWRPTAIAMVAAIALIGAWGVLP